MLTFRRSNLSDPTRRRARSRRYPLAALGSVGAGVVFAAPIVFGAESAVALPVTEVVALNADVFERPGEPMRLGGTEGRAAVLHLDKPMVAAMVAHPGDVRRVSLTLEVEPATGRPVRADGVSLRLYRLLRPVGDADPRLIDLEAGEDYAARPVAVARIGGDRELREARGVTVSGLADWVRRHLSGEWPAHGLLITAVRVNGHLDELSVTLAAEQPAVEIASIDKHQLFDFRVVPRDGVYTRADGSRLRYGDQRLRLWGVATSLNHEPHTAERLSRLGFNAIRLWGDGGQGNNRYYTPEDGAKGRLSQSERLDRYDRFVASCRENGLFVMSPILMTPMNTETLLRDDSFVAGGDDWEQWKQAVREDGREALKTYAIFDDRLREAYWRHIEAFLNHVNPYTGRSYAREETIALWELGNENWLINRLIGGEAVELPAYFEARLRERWNAWLMERYRSNDRLRRAWGELRRDESLERGSVGLAPAFGQRADYPEARARDFVEFVSGLVSDFLLGLEAHARQQAPEGVGVNVVPFSFDTLYRPNMPWLYSTAGHADVSNFGMYFWSLTSSLTAPPRMFVMDSMTVAGKPTVIYETNNGRPNPYRVEQAMRNAAIASWQDWDAMFWHYYHIMPWPDERFLVEPMPPMTEDFYWSAVETERDPAMLSAIALAGQIFLQQSLEPAGNPVRYVIGRDGMYGYELWHGVDTGNAAFRRGAVIDFQPRLDEAMRLANASEAELRPPSGAVRSGDQITWDWPNGRLIIDSPTAKAYVGRPPPGGGWHRFADGVAVGGFDTDFVAFGIVSADGKPLTGPDATSRLFVNARYDAKNTGFVIDDSIAKPNGGFVSPIAQARHIRNPGRAPIVETPVRFTVAFDQEITGTWTGYDFAHRRVHTEQLTGQSRLVQDGRPLFMGVLDIEERGGSAELPDANTSLGSLDRGTARPLAKPFEGFERGDHPIGLDWDDPTDRTYDKLKAGVIAFRSLTPRPETTSATIGVSGTNAVLDTPADVTIRFIDNRMHSVEVAFSNPPALAEAIDQLAQAYGEPSTRQIADAAYDVSTVTWDTDGPTPMAVSLLETQGRVMIRYERR